MGGRDPAGSARNPTPPSSAACKRQNRADALSKLATYRTSGGRDRRPHSELAPLSPWWSAGETARRAACPSSATPAIPGVCAAPAWDYGELRAARLRHPSN